MAATALLPVIAPVAAQAQEAPEPGFRLEATNELDTGFMVAGGLDECLPAEFCFGDLIEPKYLSELIGGRQSVVTNNLEVIPEGGFSGPVTLEVDGLPPGVTSEMPSEIEAGASVPFALKASLETGFGEFVVTVRATSGSITETLELTVEVAEELPIQPLAALGEVAVPEPENLGEFVVDREAAEILGKALFWDMQAGSDGIQACATCHFNAGADSRSQNVLSPVGAGSPNPPTFEAGGPNAALVAEDFPFHQLADPADADSEVLRDADDVVSSPGVVLTEHAGVEPGRAADLGEILEDSVFDVGGTAVRRIEPRNAPTVINAVFNFRNFYDGRAQNQFNGVNPFGDRDPDAKVVKATPAQLEEVSIRLEDSSLASQAVGPPLSDFEMSNAGRSFPDIGRKLISLAPLGQQKVHPEDSVLGPFARDGRGLDVSYLDLVRRAFAPEWWQSELLVRVEDDGSRSFVPASDRVLAPNVYTLAEANFSLFWGLAIQVYESTLVSDETPLDLFLAGDETALTEIEKDGLDLFEGKARCVNCHGGPEMTNASVFNVRNEPLETMEMGNGEFATYDNGFYNIGVRPTEEDLGVGGTDPFDSPLSDTLREGTEGRVAVDGAFKTPALRNLALTAPYLHTGGEATIRQVVEFYNRGGNFADTENRDPDIQELSLSRLEIFDLEAFLDDGLIDQRVLLQQAPFDHPQLFVPDGYPGTSTSVPTTRSEGRAVDNLREIPAVGASGGQPLRGFLEPTGLPLVLSSGPGQPPAPAQPVAGGDGSGSGSDSDSGFPWVVVAAGVGATIGLAAVLAARRRRLPGVTTTLRGRGPAGGEGDL